MLIVLRLHFSQHVTLLLSKKTKNPPKNMLILVRLQTESFHTETVVSSFQIYVDISL